MAFSEVVGSVLAGLLTALVWALLAVGYSYFRDWRIRRKLAKQFFPNGFSFFAGGNQGFKITNDTGTEITVCSVQLVDGPLGHNKIGFSFYAKQSDKDITVTAADRVVMPPFTNGVWIAPPVSCLEGCTEIPAMQGCRVCLQYKSILGDTKQFYICPPMKSRMQSMIARSYNKMYGLPRSNPVECQVTT